MKSPAIKDFDRKIAAGGFLEISCYGTLLVIKEASAGFDFSFDDGPKSFGEGGYSVDTGTDYFRTVTVHNRSTTAALTVSLRIGKGSGQAGVKYDYLRKRSVVIEPTEDGAGFLPATLAIAASKRIPGINANGLRRSHCIVSNHNTTSGVNQDLWLIKSDDSFATGECFGIVRAGQDRIVEGDADFYIYNPGVVGAVTYSTETHYFL